MIPYPFKWGMTTCYSKEQFWERRDYSGPYWSYVGEQNKRCKRSIFQFIFGLLVFFVCWYFLRLANLQVKERKC